MQIRVEVREAVKNRRDVPTKSGNVATFFEQPVWALLFDRSGKVKPYPEEIVLPLKENEEPYPPGQYVLAPASVWANRFKRLDLAPKLLPVK